MEWALYGQGNLAIRRIAESAADTGYLCEIFKEGEIKHNILR
jgi:hypothetical protein